MNQSCFGGNNLTLYGNNDLDLEPMTSPHNSNWSKTLIFEFNNPQKPNLDMKIIKFCQFVTEI